MLNYYFGTYMFLIFFYSLHIYIENKMYHDY